MHNSHELYRTEAPVPLQHSVGENGELKRMKDEWHEAQPHCIQGPTEIQEMKNVVGIGILKYLKENKSETKNDFGLKLR